MGLSKKQVLNIERLISDINEGELSAINYCQRQLKCSFWDAKEIVRKVTSGELEATNDQ